MPRPPTVLGLRIGGSDPAASLLIGGAVVESVSAAHVRAGASDVHPPDFPAEAIEHCLSSAGLTAADVDHVAHVDDSSLTGLGPAERGVPELFAQHFSLQPGAPPACFHHVEERRALLANAFYSSPWDAAAVATIGGFRDPSGAVWGAGFDTALSLGGEVTAPHSPAPLTAAFTRHLGLGDEPRVLGDLVRHDPRAGRRRAGELVRLGSRGRFEWIHPAASSADPRSWSDWLTCSFGPARHAGEPLELRHLHAADVLRCVLESIVLHVLQHLAAETELDRLCLTGGVASTPGLVARIREATPFREVFTGEAGRAGATADAATGAALDIWYRGLAFPRAPSIVREARLADCPGPAVQQPTAPEVGAAG